MRCDGQRRHRRQGASSEGRGWRHRTVARKIGASGGRRQMAGMAHSRQGGSHLATRDQGRLARRKGARVGVVVVVVHVSVC